MSLQVTHGIDIGHSRILLDVWLLGVLVPSILAFIVRCRIVKIVAAAASIVAIIAATTKATTIIVVGDILRSVPLCSLLRLRQLIGGVGVGCVLL